MEQYKDLHEADQINSESFSFGSDKMKVRKVSEISYPLHLIVKFAILELYFIMISQGVKNASIVTFKTLLKLFMVAKVIWKEKYLVANLKCMLNVPI